MMTSFYSAVVPFIRIRPLFREPSIQNPFEIPADSAFQNELRSNTARNSLPSFNRILPPYKSVFDQLLQRYGNEGVGGRGEFDYIAATAYSPLHRGVEQQTPAWIITHLGVEGEGKVSEYVKLEPGTTIRLYDHGLSERDFGFERVWLFGKIGEVYCREPGCHLHRLTPHLFTMSYFEIVFAVLEHFWWRKHCQKREGKWNCNRRRETIVRSQVQEIMPNGA